ncbi:hypothetical protein H310_11691 [Aphanomyces invadans]|uniref:Uncharacterized protein n=1 Tax=Aphanomyces invadans TaxID=157072 RepID=A0A024TL45_9STRA|nr:hypothetical protein H310_11691 [Aphanomyces invadans]ETV94724.1 hypothetical protein H310_11691 [Aphanomyces invadans]|eukprot:XP_008876669.1 hypothetical protein H310_11691 [Aphanomyces invadans]
MARFTVDTGDALAAQSHEAIMSSLFTSTQTDAVKAFLSEFVQITLLGRGGILFSATSSSVRKALGGQYLSILGKRYLIPVQEEHPLDSLCYMDVTGIRDNLDATQFYRKLTQLGVDVAYQSHRAVIPGTGCHTNAWRVYFADGSIPKELMIHGVSINQIKYQKFDHRVYFKGTKGTPFHGANGVSLHCLDLEVKRTRDTSMEQHPDIDTATQPAPPCRVDLDSNASKKPKNDTTVSQPNSRRTAAERTHPNVAHTSCVFASSLQRSIVGTEATSMSTPEPHEHIDVYEDDGEIGEMDIDDSKDTHLFMEVDQPYQVVQRRGKRKERTRTALKNLEDFATPNFFDVLRRNNGGFRVVQWREKQDIVTIVPTFQRQFLSEEDRKECIATYPQVGNALFFDVETMSIERLHEILETSIQQLHHEELEDIDRTFSDAAADTHNDLTGYISKG